MLKKKTILATKAAPFPPASVVDGKLQQHARAPEEAAEA